MQFPLELFKREPSCPGSLCAQLPLQVTSDVSNGDWTLSLKIFKVVSIKTPESCDVESIGIQHLVI